MARCLIFIRLVLDWEDLDVARDYVRDLHERLQSVPGYQGGGAWRGVQNPHTRLVLFSYASGEAARAGFAAVGEIPTMIERQTADAHPADVKVLLVEEANGLFDGGLPTAHPVSLSVRLAEPGYGPEMLDEYRDVFGGLGTMPGYGGGLIGTSEKLTDEVVGLVAWRDEASFDASIPAASVYPVDLYEPLGEKG